MHRENKIPKLVINRVILHINFDPLCCHIIFIFSKNVRQISVGDLAAMAERWKLEHGANFNFLIFSASWGGIEKYYIQNCLE